jgi:hypothetical protein
MEWIVDPLSNFAGLNPVFSESCPNIWYQCNCTGGLLVCAKEGALKAPPD